MAFTRGQKEPSHVSCYGNGTAEPIGRSTWGEVNIIARRVGAELDGAEIGNASLACLEEVVVGSCRDELEALDDGHTGITALIGGVAGTGDLPDDVAWGGGVTG